MAADLGLVAHAAQGDAGELASQRIGHAPAQGSFAHAGRADQAEDRAFDLFPALDDGQELQQAILDLRQPEMLLVEDALGFGQIEFVLGLLHPRQAEDPVQVMPANAVFRRGGGICWRRSSSWVATCFASARQGGLLDLVAQRADFAGVGVGLAQFALDGAHLLAQEEVALGLGDGGGDLALDLGAEREHLMLAVKHRQEAGETFLDGSGLEQLLPLLEGQVQVDGDQVGKVAGVFGIKGGDLDLLGEGGRELDDFLELALSVAHHRRQFDRILLQVVQQLELGGQVGDGLGILLDLNPPQALDEHPHGVVGEFEHLQHARRAADLVHLCGQRVLRLRRCAARPPPADGRRRPRRQ